ncbi:MAG: histidinol-phosphate transaminase [Ramlibacter sp.]
MPAARVHGGPDSEGTVTWDFSTNANACGPCPQALAAVLAADAASYCDPAYGALRETLAARHGVDAARIVCAGSASEFIFRITAWAARQGVCSVCLPVHAYGDYAQAARAWNLEPTALPLRGSLVWACDPSSPFGTAHPDRASFASSKDLIAVLDRAYEPLRLEQALALNEHDLGSVWQLWTPNKALGLTGVRGAYAIAPLGAHEAVAELDAMAPSWVIGAHGVAMLQAWCEPAVQQWLAASLSMLRKWKYRQIELCEALGWRVMPSHANFFVCDLEEPLSVITRKLAALRSCGVRLRDCASFGLRGRVRLSVQPPAAQLALRRSWESLA